MVIHPVRPGPAPAVGAHWPIVACVAGLLALAAAFLPFGIGLIAVAFAGVGGAAGIAARVHGAPRRGLAVAGVSTSALAIVIAGVTVAVYHPGTDPAASHDSESSWIGSTSNTDEILRDYLRVSFGAIDPAGSSLLPVTLTSTLDRAASAHVVVAGFIGGREIARDTDFVTLAGKATQRVGMFYRYLNEDRIPQLRKAQFRVVEATLYWHTG
ncbi:hypothetical protein ACAG26_13795 [Mycobacterium sp. pUA109]|uniref:hypothetical protein n=1 Tax=Mycobacterium sp. pUA109 TaxID=3238982 RepID=UPI00351BD825